MQFEDIFLQSVDSTQKYAKKNIKNIKADQIICIVADEQTEGKGRFDRSWFCEKNKNLYVTFVFSLPIKTLHITSIGHVLALSLIDVLKKENLDPKIKWPNDVMLNNKKISGILCEVVSKDNDFTLFLGIGINVNSEKEFLKKIDQPATSLKVETNKNWDRKELLEKLKKAFLKNLKIFKEKGFTPFHEEFENLLLYVGENITLFDGQKEYNGLLHSINCEGQLNLYLPNKEIKTFAAGDIIKS